MDPGSIRGAAQQPVQPPGPGRGAAGRLGGAGKGMAAAAGGGAAAGRQYKGFLDALVRIGKEEGLRGYYKGLGPSLVLVSG
jgi:solute carrier family 25 folate transporter 32